MQLIKSEKCKLSINSLTLSKDIGKTEWLEIGKQLNFMEGSIQFWIGDWIIQGCNKWGELYEEVERVTGLSYQTLNDYKWVCESVQFSLRKENCSYGHHKEVAKLETDEQVHYLDIAERENLSTRELRQLIKNNTVFVTREMPKGQYDLIYADPPWRYDFSETDSRKVENNYPTMSVEDICNIEKKIKIPAFKDSLLLMWATAPKLEQAFQVIAAWGFAYKTHAIWDKQKIGMGYWFRGQHELLMVATKGEFSPPIPELRRSSILSYPRGKHSEKPKEVYQLIEDCFPHTKKLELFQRGNKRKGWETWGNE